MTSKPDIFNKFTERIGVKVDWNVIDDLMVSDANIIRPIKGAAFEYLFDLICEKTFNIKNRSGIGDSNIDRAITDRNGKDYTLQFKTCITKSVKEGVCFSVNLHKTHGLEKKPKSLYPKIWPCPVCEHDGEKFPDLLLVMHPRSGILLIPKNEIPENKRYQGHFEDPVCFEWDSEWLNRWDLIGFPEFKGMSLERRVVDKQYKFPKLSQIIKLTDEEIVSLMLKPENFRIIDMNLMGNLREPALVELLKKENITLLPPGIPYAKFDKKTERGTRIQIKGPSKNLSNPQKNILGVEVMGTHGYGSIRCYSDTDFDYLGFVIDPKYINSSFGLNMNYHYCLIPICDLPKHYKNEVWKSTSKIYPVCKFTVAKDIEGVYLKPQNNYRVKVKFMGNGPWYIDKIPSSFNNS